MIISVSRAMQEQSVSVTQITSAADSMRQQTDQTAKAMAEQSRAVRDVAEAARSISKQIGLITRANREHSAAAVGLLNGLTEVRQVTERNAQGVKETLRSTGGLLERAESLNVIIDGLQSNGRAAKKSKNKKKK